MTATIALFNPAPGFAATETSQGKPFRGTFTEKFSLALHCGHEVADPAKAIAEVFAVR